jgi:hypothetical protein
MGHYRTTTRAIVGNSDAEIAAILWHDIREF